MITVKRIFICLCALFMLSPFAIGVNALDTSAKSAILIDAGSGTVLYEKNADERLSMASTTKIMTALVALESGDIDREVTVPREAVGVEGTSVCLKEGEILTLRELLYAMMLESANDAAAAIAVAVGGSIEDFALMMNEKAESLGLADTSFENPHGLDGENHYTTARNLAILAAHALENPDFCDLVSTYKKSIPYGEGGSRYLLNHNKMLKMYDGAIGVKTGFTKKSGRCLVSAAERDGMTLVAVTLSCPDDWRDHRAMLDYGFDNYAYRRLTAGGEMEYYLECVGADSNVTVSNCGDVYALMKKSEDTPKVSISLPRFVYAPVEAGEVIGKVVFTSGDRVLGESVLAVTVSQGAKVYKKSLFEKIFGQ